MCGHQEDVLRVGQEGGAGNDNPVPVQVARFSRPDWQQRDTTVRLACNHPFLISGNIRSKTATQAYCRALGVDVADVHRISIAAECRLVRECQQRAVAAEDRTP